MEKEIRLLRADEIECRIATINEKGLSLLLYKDARVDFRILDEVYGTMGWQRSHQVIEGNLYCTISLWDEEKKQWVSKQDVGTKSYSEQEKGQASDSFKRAAFCVGIGRELYTAPFIWIAANKVNIQLKGDRYITYDKFKVQHIGYNDNREIVELTIVNEAGQSVYELKAKATNKAVQEGLTVIQKKVLEEELLRTGVALESVLERFKVSSLEEMTQDTYKKALNGLKKTASRQVA